MILLYIFCVVVLLYNAVKFLTKLATHLHNKNYILLKGKKP
jgi:hypothetical protein